MVDVRGKLGAHVPKAQGLKRRGQGRDHATQKAPEECDRQMEKLTDRLSAHYSKKLSTHKTLGSNILM